MADTVHPFAQRRLPYPQIRRNTVAWQPAGQRNPRSVLVNAPHCLRCFTLTLELFTMLDHLNGLLDRVFNPRVTGAKPLQVYFGRIKTFG
jgi:hypothetical protein